MRIFIVVLVLIFSFQSFSKASDISEFEIESMSVGESLLNHFTKEEIKLFIKSPNSFTYKDNKYVAISTHASYDKYSVSSDKRFGFATTPSCGAPSNIHFSIKASCPLLRKGPPSGIKSP